MINNNCLTTIRSARISMEGRLRQYTNQNPFNRDGQFKESLRIYRSRSNVKTERNANNEKTSRTLLQEGLLDSPQKDSAFPGS
jgi:hypothetical protein